MRKATRVRKNPYGKLIPGWKNRLIDRRAKRMGFTADDLSDVRQQLALAVLSFQFDPSRSNGASEKTALTALVDRQLWTIRRTWNRYQERIERLQAWSHPQADTEFEQRMSLLLDVREAIAELDADDRWLCKALSEGQTIDAIAAQLGCSWHTVKRRVERLRERFEEMDLNPRVD